jgi:predicted lipoprotein with Yx(FWY)xxD motif
VNGYKLNEQNLINGRGMDFSLSHRNQTAAGACPASSPIQWVPKIKWLQSEGDHPSLYSDEGKNMWSNATIPHHVVLKPRGNFNLYKYY